MLQRPHDTAHEDVSEDSRRESRTVSCEGAPAGRTSRLPFMHRRSFLAGSLGLMAGLFCDHALTASGFGSTVFAAEEEKADVLADYAARLQYHMENNGDLRLPALSARDRRRAIPNDKRPPARRTPVTTLPPNPSALEGVVRRVHIESGEKVCALTFDMCELATTTTGFDADIVIWLQDNNIPATFFMGGKWMRTHERRVRQILRDPLFEIGNHAWAHGNFALLSPERMREEILDTQSQYELLREENIANAGRSGLGESLPPPEALRLFRFPYASMVGTLIGFTALIPVAGAYIGAGVGAFMIFTVSPIQALLFLVFIVVLQQLEGNLIYPKVVGSSIGLPGIWVLAAVTVGGGILGIFGMLLAVPLAATFYQMLRYDVKRRSAPPEPAAASPAPVPEEEDSPEPGA